MSSSETSAASATPAARTHSRARSIAFVGLSIALITCCAWVTIPLGPIPITLQMFGIPLMIFLLRPSEAVAAIAGYLALGIIGLPLFSGMRGGLGVIMGPTGGYLLGYLPGVIAAALFLHLTRPLAVRYRRKHAAAAQGATRPTLGSRLRADALGCAFQVIAGLLFTVFAYTTAWLQAALVSGISPEAAFLAYVAPFIVPDLLKVLVAVVVAQPIRAALPNAHA